MRRNQVDRNKISYILSQADLEHYNLTIKDFAYGSEKSKVFMSSLIEQLSKEINFNPEHSNLSVELIPLENGELKIEVSAIDREEEFNILFSNIIKEGGELEMEQSDFYMDESSLYEDTLFEEQDAQNFHHSKKEEEFSFEPILILDSETNPDMDEQNNLSPIMKAHSSKTATNSASFLHAFELETLDEIIHISHVIKHVNTLKSSLYKDKMRSCYLLLLEGPKKNQDIKGICNLIMENGGKPNHRYTIKSYCEEHLELIIKENALEQLSCI